MEKKILTPIIYTLTEIRYIVFFFGLVWCDDVSIFINLL